MTREQRRRVMAAATLAAAGASAVVGAALLPPAAALGLPSTDAAPALVLSGDADGMVHEVRPGVPALWNVGVTVRRMPVRTLVGIVASQGGFTSGDTAGLATITQVAPIDVQFSVPQDRVADIQAAQGAADALAVTALDRTRKTELGQGTFSTLDNQVDTTSSPWGSSGGAIVRYEGDGTTLRYACFAAKSRSTGSWLPVHKAGSGSGACGHP